MRTVTLKFESEDMDALINVAGEQAQQAIGRLSAWGWSHPHVDIYLDGNPDLIAVYQREDGTRVYVISAIWNPGSKRYSFNS